jgi:hypothetical protein
MAERPARLGNPSNVYDLAMRPSPGLRITVVLSIAGQDSIIRTV